MIRPVRVVSLLLSIALIGARLSAQTVRGAVVDPTGHGVPGVVVLLVDIASNIAGRSLSDANGDFRVAAPRAGTFRVRTLRIGFRPTESAPISLLSGGESTQRLVLTGAQVALDTMRVVDRRACNMNTDSAAAATFAVWEQARTALTAAQVTSGNRALTATTLTYDRTLEPDQRHVRTQRSNVATATVAQPWKIVPADSLHRAGYIVTDRTNTMAYYAPGIEVLLAPVFVEDHCFHLVTDRRRAGEMGLAFEPTPQRRGIPEIRGTLWLDRKTAELRNLEYRYTNALPAQEDAGAGGEIDYARLSNGGWAIARWNIRMPVLTQVFRSQELGGNAIQVAEVVIAGGQLVLATLPSARGRDTVFARPPLTLAGSVVDSASGRGMAKAQVSLGGTSLRTVTDDRGRFSLPGVLPGAYTARVRTADLDAIGAVSESSVIFADSNATVELKVPTAERFAEALCGAGKLTGGGGMIIGTVRTPVDSAPRRGTSVAATWTAGTETKRVVGRTDDGGGFRLCGIPTNAAVSLQASDDSVESAVTPLQLGAQRFVRADLQVARAEHAASFTGMVVDSAQRPILAATVSVVDAGASTISDNKGHFTIDSLAAGQHHVQIRRVGYGALDTTLMFANHAATDRRIVLPRVSTLDSVVVSAPRNDPEMREFEENRKLGLGYYFTRDQLERDKDMDLSHILSAIPGASIVHTHGGGYLIGTRGTPAGCDIAMGQQPTGYNADIAAHAVLAGKCAEAQGFYVKQPGDPMDLPMVACYSEVIVNGRLFNPGDPTPYVNMDTFRPSEIEAIEYYSGPSRTPMRYMQFNAKCGVVVIHTREYR